MNKFDTAMKQKKCPPLENLNFEVLHINEKYPISDVTMFYNIYTWLQTIT